VTKRRIEIKWVDDISYIAIGTRQETGRRRRKMWEGDGMRQKVKKDLTLSR